MTKQLVITTGDFELVDYSGSSTVVIGNKRPAVVDNTSFIQARAAAGQIKVLDNDLPDDAKDEDFGEYWDSSEGDQPLAVESFKSSFTSDAATPKKPGRKSKDEAPAKE